MLKILLLVVVALAVVNADKSLREAFEPFSKLTNQFLSTVQPNDNLKYIFETLLGPMLNGGSINISNEVSPLLIKNVGYIILVAIGILFILFFTLIGCICCCCETCCKSKSRTGASESMKTKRIVLHVFIIVFTCLMALGAIVAIVSSQVLHDAVLPAASTKDPDRNIVTNLKKTFTYATDYIQELSNNIITKVAPELSNAANNIGNAFIGIAKKLINAVLDPVMLNLDSMNTSLTQMVSDLNDMKTNAENLSRIAQNHMNESRDLNGTIISTKAALDAALGTCSTTQCVALRNNLKYNLGYQISNINYTVDIALNATLSLMDTSSLSSAVTTLNTTKNLLKNETTKAIELMKSTFGSVINSSGLSDLIPADGGLGSIQKQLKDLDTQVEDNIGNLLKTNQSLVSYGFMGLAILIGFILFICLFFAFGVGFGMCGEPNHEDASKCNKRVGRSCYLASFGLSVIFSWLLMLLATIFFISGGLIQTELCKYIAPSSSIAYHKLIDDQVNVFLKDVSIPLGNVSIKLPQLSPYSGIMNDCPKEISLIRSIGITQEFQNSLFENVMNTFIKPFYAQIDSQLDNVNLPAPNLGSLTKTLDDFGILLDNLTDPSENKTLEELRKNTLGNFSRAGFIKAINDQYAATSDDTYLTQKNELLNQTDKVTALRDEYLKKKEKIISLRNSLKLSLGSIQSIVNNLNATIISNKNKAVNTAKKDYPALFSSNLKTALDKVFTILGDCKKLYLALSTGINVVCRDFLYPYNNIWLGIGFYLLFIIAAIACSMSAGNTYLVGHVDSGNVHFNNAYMGSETKKQTTQK